MANPFRSTMADLVTRVRGKINDLQGLTFTDLQIQDKLDRYRLVARFAPLRPEPYFIPGGIVHYLDYFADFGDWEEGYQLFDNRFGVIEGAPDAQPPLTPANGTLYSEDLLTGHWVFEPNANSQTTDGFTNGMPFGQIPVVRITGFTYDIWAASAALLEEWAAQVTLEFNFSTNQQTFYRNQQFEMLMKLAEQYWEKARPKDVAILRGDQTDASYLPTNQWVGTGYYA